ncbi:MAG: hypothetical protein RIC06_15090 [Cyclobacteriaceae bacterium]
MKIESLKKEIIRLWNDVVSKEFESTGFMWERHLQAVLYHHLRISFPNLEIWIEPVFRVNGYDVKPDILITLDKQVIGIMELKFNPWQYIVYQNDLKKLMDLDSYDEEIALACRPVSYAERPMENHRVKYTIKDDCLMVFASVGRDGSAAFDVSKWGDVDLPRNFMNLYGYVDELNEARFKVS